MAQTYISVDAETRTSQGEVKLTNMDNEFRGKLMSSPRSGTGSPVDVMDLFLSGIKIGENAIESSQDEEGRRFITIPTSVRAFKTIWR